MIKSMGKTDVAKGILANVLHDISPTRTVKEWEEHIEKYGNDPKAFFGENGAGYEEYLAFVNTYDKDKYLKNKKNRRSQYA